MTYLVERLAELRRHNLAKDDRFSSDLVQDLERLPGFRNVVIHDYVALDMNRVMEALTHLEPIEQFVEIVAQMEAGNDS